MMLSDKPKLIFTDIAGKPTLSASLPCQQIKQAKQYQQKPQDQFQTALNLCGRAIF